MWGLVSKCRNETNTRQGTETPSIRHILSTSKWDKVEMRRIPVRVLKPPVMLRSRRPPKPGRNETNTRQGTETTAVICWSASSLSSGRNETNTRQGTETSPPVMTACTAIPGRNETNTRQGTETWIRLQLSRQFATQM